MNLLTWHGTVLRVENATQRLIQAPPVPQRPSARDYAIPAAILAAGQALPLPGGNGVQLHPGPTANTRHLTIGGRYATATPGQPDITAAAPSPGQDGTFLILAPEALAALRHLLRGEWRATPGADPLPITLAPGFQLHLGDTTIPLDGATLLALGATEVFLAAPATETPDHAPPDPASPDPATPAAAPATLTLRTLTPASHAQDLHLRAAPAGTLNTPLGPPPAPEFLHPPLTIGLPDRAWLHGPGGLPLPGPTTPSPGLQRATAPLILLCSPAEGVAFAPSGQTEQHAALAALLASPPAALLREAGSLFLPAPLLDQAPYLPGAYVIPYAQAPASHTDILLHLLPRLALLTPYLPPGATLLLPAHAHADTEALLTLAGFTLPVLREHAPLCQPDTAFLAAAQSPLDLPQAAFTQLQTRIQHAAPPAAASRKLYFRVSAPLSVQNTAPAEAMAADQGFDIITLSALTAAQTASLFAAAATIAAPSGPALAWTIFSPPGLRILELADAGAPASPLAGIAPKLGHTHLILPCPGSSPGSGVGSGVGAGVGAGVGSGAGSLPGSLPGSAGGLTVNPARLRAAIWTLAHRQ